MLYGEENMLKNMIKITLLAAVCGMAPLVHAANNAQYLEAEIGRLRQMVTALQDENANYQTAVAELRRKQNELQQDNQKLHEELRQIRELVKQDAAARDAQLRKLSEQLEKLANMPVPTAPAVVPTPAPTPQPLEPVTDTPEEYEVYIVEKGATLSVIARVYGVSISDIKRANKLKSDLLKIGQKLLIPVRKK